MAMNANELSAILKNQIKNFETKLEQKETGTVVSVGDGIALVSGLSDVMYGELLIFADGVIGMALNLEEEVVGVALMGSDQNISEGDIVKKSGSVISVPVGDKLLGRVVNALGQPIDLGEQINIENKKEIFKVAPGVMTREGVNEPLETGIIAIDSMIPIGKGQRELIIGDRQTGKTSVALDTIINQKGKNVKCIYVAIGQKNSTVAQVVEKLDKAGALGYTTIVSATASETAPLQYIAPYAGITMAENWCENGDDVLIIYDDLSKHAVAYRTLSLLLRRPPGREAYPGDVFYLHSQLLERAVKLSKEYGGGSITALPIIETQAGDISAYIPTNVISITDGQMFMMSDLFNSGQRPAVDAGYSVSRVGSAAQIPAIKKVSSSLKLELAQYNEMEAFAQFGSDLDADTQKILTHGKKVLEIIKQKQYAPLSQVDQAIILLSLKERLTNNVPVEKISEFKDGLINYFKSDSKAEALWRKIDETKDLNDNLYKDIVSVIEKFVSDKYPVQKDESKEKNNGIPIPEQSIDEVGVEDLVKDKKDSTKKEDPKDINSTKENSETIEKSEVENK